MMAVWCTVCMDVGKYVFVYVCNVQHTAQKDTFSVYRLLLHFGNVTLNDYYNYNENSNFSNKSLIYSVDLFNLYVVQ